jgi:dolichol-phosphate mannosyltransferase
MSHLSVVIPVYRADGCLEELYRRLCESLTTITSDFEIVLVEDCGEDRSWPIILDLAKRDPRVKGIQFTRNFGQHYGITAGLDHCDGDWIVVMDCDLQDRPEEIPRLYQRAQDGFDVVLAKRGRRQDGLVKRLTSWAFYRVFSYLADIDFDGNVGNFRIMSRQVAACYCSMREQLRFFGGLMQWMGYPHTSIDVRHDDRFSGPSSYSVRKLWRLASDTIIAFSDKPLRLAVRFGFIISFFAFVYGAYVIYLATRYGVPITGWSSLIVSLYFLGGIIISILGIIGIYLGKTFDETKRRPLYVIRQMTNSMETR